MREKEYKEVEAGFQNRISYLHAVRVLLLSPFVLEVGVAEGLLCSQPLARVNSQAAAHLQDGARVS